MRQIPGSSSGGRSCLGFLIPAGAGLDGAGDLGDSTEGEDATPCGTGDDGLSGGVGATLASAFDSLGLSIIVFDMIRSIT